MKIFLNLYLFFSFIVIISANFVIFANNIIYSLLWLLCCFLFSACLLLLLGCEFLSLILIVIYVGAIAVLFLFVIMLLDLKIKTLKNYKNQAVSFSVFFCFIFLSNVLFFNFNLLKYEILSNIFSQTIEKKTLFFSNFEPIYINWHDFLTGWNEIETYCLVLFDIFVVEFLLVGFILLIVLLGIVFLVNNYKTYAITTESNFKQIAVNSNFFYN